VNYLSFVTSTSSPNLPIRALEFTNCTGGIISFSEAANVWEDPIQDLGTSLNADGRSNGDEVFDGYFMSYSHFPEASNLELAEHLNDRIRNDNTRFKWEDVLPKVQQMGKYRKDGETHIDFLMYDGDFFVPLVRLDLLEAHDKPLPNTWQEVVELAMYFNNSDLNDDGEPDYGFCHFPRLGAGYWDWWWPEALYSTWATSDQTHGMDQGFFFDETTMEPRIRNSGFRQAAEVWRELWRHGSDGCITPNFSTGRCAIGFAPPGCWKGLFLDPRDESEREGGDPFYGVKRTDENGTVVWYPKLKSGEYAEPYRFKPFGSTEVYDRETNALIPCTSRACPKAEPITPLTDRASILPPSPLLNQLINRAPFYWSGGLGTMIRKSTTLPKKDCMWDFFVYTNSPDTSVYDVANYASWLDSWRHSQLSSRDQFLRAGWSERSYEEHTKVMHWALSKESNGALNLRIPGLAEYTRDVVGGAMMLFIEGEISSTQLVDDVEREWNDITYRRKTLEQLDIYRAALGLDSLSEVEKCRLHRTLMDDTDPSVCRRYDPLDQATLLWAILAPTFMAILGLIAYYQMSRRMKAADSVWAIQSHELRFSDPPDIAGRGTFGLVLIAEYRGTRIAVKRVIPPRVENVSKGKNGSLHGVSRNSLLGNGYTEDKIARMKRRSSFDFVNETYSPEKESEHTVDAWIGQDHVATTITYGETQKTSVGWDASVDTKQSSKIRNNNNLDAMCTPPKETQRSTEVTVGTNSGRSTSGFGLGSTSLNSDSSMTRLLGKGSGSFSSWLHLKKKVSRTNDEYSRLKSDFIVEMRHLSKLRHPCITTVMGAVISKKDEPMLVMEYMDHGSLYDILHNDTLILEGDIILPILRDISQGMRFLHAADPKVIHGDLKAHNVLVDSKFRAKVADFGLSAKKCIGATGTPFWMAPELLRGESQNSTASDIYSFGIILYEVYSRKDPYQGESTLEVLRDVADPAKGKRPPVPPACPLKVSSIMIDCLMGDPEVRPNFEEIDMRLKRLDVESVEPGDYNLSKRMKKMRRRQSQSEELLLDIFPKHIADQLREGRKVRVPLVVTSVGVNVCLFFL